MAKSKAFTAKQANLILGGTDSDWVEYLLFHDEREPYLEPYILKFPNAARIYAKYVLHRRWPEAEPVIRQDAHAAYLYATDVIHGRWPEAEPVIANSAFAYVYARYVIHGRWPEAEPAIRQDPVVWRWYTSYYPEAGT
jgi:hypothetical protein